MEEEKALRSEYSGNGSRQYLHPPKNIWLNVYADEDISSVTSQMESVGVKDISKHIIHIDRGPESYCIDRRMLSKYRGKAKKRKVPTVTNEVKEEGELKSDVEESDSSISSGGLSDDSIQQIRNRQLGRKVKKYPLRKRKFRRHCRDEEIHYSDVEEYTGIICSNLREPNRDLVAAVINLIGIPAAANIYKKVLKIEENGGIMIKSRERRRTPGGVFFLLAQNHPKTASENLKKIFQRKQKSVKRKKDNW